MLCILPTFDCMCVGWLSGLNYAEVVCELVMLVSTGCNITSPSIKAIFMKNNLLNMLSKLCMTKVE